MQQHKVAMSLWSVACRRCISSTSTTSAALSSLGAPSCFFVRRSFFSASLRETSSSSSCRCCGSLIGTSHHLWCVSHRISAVNARRTFAAAAGASAADKKKQSTPEQKQQAKTTTTGDPEKIEVDTNAESSYTDEALKLKGRVEAELKQMSPEAQLARVKALEKTGAEHLTMEQFEDAELVYHTCVTVREKFLPEDDLDTAKIKLNFAFALQNTGKRELSIAQYKKAIEVVKKHEGKDHYKVGEGLLNYAEVLSLVGNFDEAIQVSRESINVLKKNFREDSEYIGAALNNLGSYLAGAQKYEEALPIVQEALKILDKALGPESSYTKSAVMNLVQLYKDLKRDDEAQKVAKEWESVHPTVGGESNFDIQPSPEIMEKYRHIFEKEVEKPKSFDLKGFFKDKDVSKDQLLKFVEEWTKANPNIDPVIFKQMIMEAEGVKKQSEEETKNGHEFIKKL